MHSTQFTAAAQLADDIFFGSIVASCDLPYSHGTVPAAHVIILRDENPRVGYSVNMVVFQEGGNVVYTAGAYDLTRAEAFDLWNERVERDCSGVDPEPMPA